MMPLCANGSVLWDGPDDLIKQGMVLAAGCRCWGCERCGPIRAREIQTRLSAALVAAHEEEVAWLCHHELDPADAWHIFKVVTLTVDVANVIPEERYHAKDWKAGPDEALRTLEEVKRAWNRLHSWLRKLWRRHHVAAGGERAKWEKDGKTVPYFWAAEFTQNGWPHLHVVLLWRPQIPFPDVEKIRALWNKYGIGRIVDVENKNWKWERPQQLAAYLGKYLGKQWGSWSNGFKIRRWSSSRAFLPKKVRAAQEGEAGWSPAPVEAHRLYLKALGATCRDIRDGFLWEHRGESILS